MKAYGSSMASVVYGSVLFASSFASYATNNCGTGRMALSFDLSQTQNAAINQTNTFITVFGHDHASNKRAFVRFNSGTGQGNLVPITNNSLNGKDFGVALADLGKNAAGLPQACIPRLSSGRIYLSFGNTLNIPTTANHAIQEPNIHDPNTTTNGTLFDKLEFTYLNNGTTVINPTGVDFIAIPYAIRQSGHEYGHLGGLDGLVTNMKTIVCKAANKAPGSADCDQKWQQSEWSSLVAYNQNNQLMRVDAPGRDGSRFNGYFNSYINALSQYYSAATERAIVMDLKERNLGLWSGSFNPNSLNLVFSRVGGSSAEKVTYYLGDAHTSNAIFLGAQYPFKNDTEVSAIISRDLSAAIVSGMLMRKEAAFTGKDFFNTSGNPVFKNRDQMYYLMDFYFNNIKESLDFSPNQCGAQHDAPCINVYSEALHALPNDEYITHPQTSYVHSYAFAYDDFLGMDGTNTQTEASAVVVVLGNMQDRKIPHVNE